MEDIIVTHPMISIRERATVKEAAQLMSDCGIGALGVLDDEKRFTGIFTERDLTWFVAQGKSIDQVTIGEVTNDFPVIAQGPLSAEEAGDRMRRARVRHLIVEEEGEYRIVSLRDLNVPVEKRTLTAQDVMTSPAVACREDAYLAEIAEILADRDISGMPVVNESGHLIGIVSERDLAHALGSPLVRLSVGRGSLPHHERSTSYGGPAVRAADVMTSPPVTATAATPLEALARMMFAAGINRVPVMDGDELAGVVTRGDLLRVLAGIERDQTPTAGPTVVGGLTSWIHERPVPFTG